MVNHFFYNFNSYDESLKIEPNDSNSWNNKGCNLMIINKYAEALE